MLKEGVKVELPEAGAQTHRAEFLATQNRSSGPSTAAVAIYHCGRTRTKPLVGARRGGGGGGGASVHGPPALLRRDRRHGLGQGRYPQFVRHVVRDGAAAASRRAKAGFEDPLRPVNGAR